MVTTNDKNRVEQAIDILSILESSLQKVEEKIAEMKRSLATLAKEDGEKAKAQTLSMVAKIADKEAELSMGSTKLEASRILKNEEKEVKKLRSRIDASLEEAVKIVMKTVSGA